MDNSSGEITEINLFLDKLLTDKAYKELDGDFKALLNERVRITSTINSLNMGLEYASWEVFSRTKARITELTTHKSHIGDELHSLAMKDKKIKKWMDNHDAQFTYPKF